NSFVRRLGDSRSWPSFETRGLATALLRTRAESVARDGATYSKPRPEEPWSAGPRRLEGRPQTPRSQRPGRLKKAARKTISIAMTAPLVSAQWLAAQSRDGLCVLDIRSAVDGGGAAAYEAAHIPGAVHTDYVKDGWRATKGTATGLLPDAQHLSALFARCGITPAFQAIGVGAGPPPGDFSPAARVYWPLKVAGHAKQSVLDGGVAAWQQAGLAVESGRHAPLSVPAYPVQFVEGLRADLTAVQQAVAQGGQILLDTRSQSYFEGHEKRPQAKRAGRVPGAVPSDHAP